MRHGFAGIPIVESPLLPMAPRERAYPDWRARLARNLGRPSAGTCEPLTYHEPNVFTVDGRMIVPVGTIARLRRNEEAN
jgi:hypothetical protein